MLVKRLVGSSSNSYQNIIPLWYAQELTYLAIPT